MKRSIIFTFPRALSEDEREYFTSAFQEVVMKPTQEAIRKEARKFSRGVYGKVIDKVGMGFFVSKLDAIAMNINAWMSLSYDENKATFTYSVDALSAMVIEVPKFLQPTVGKQIAVGRFIPDNMIIRTFRGSIFPEMNKLYGSDLTARNVAIEKRVEREE